MDITTRLRDLHTGDGAAPSSVTVGADLARGRHALARRRVRRTVAGGVGVLAVAGIATAFVLSGPAPRTAGTGAHHDVAAGAIKLVDYTGPQVHGFDVTSVPEGWQLKDSTVSYLDIAQPDDHSAGSTFVNKLVVSLQSVDADQKPQGTPVTVNGRPGGIVDQDGVKNLVYSDGKHVLDIQAWSNLHWSNDQLVQFAEGVTVTSAAVAPRG